MTPSLRSAQAAPQTRYRAVKRAGAIVAITIATACATNPVTGKSELSLISESDEIQLGQQGKKDVAQSIGLVNNQALQSYVSSLGMMIGPNSERPSLPWSYQVVDDPSVNAFALPGGPVFVTRGLLTYATSEAELMSVLGHETGHITHKHQVHQMSQQQLAGLALGVGMIVRPELQAFGNLASSALGILFLKFSRQQETEADDLGFKYMLKAGYDPREMAEMFKTLERIEQASGAKTPNWLSTHPDPGNRVQMTEQRIAGNNVPAQGLKVDRDQFLSHVDGLVFGEDPRNGYFKNTVFYHPVLKFRFDFPSGWTTQNAADQVAAMSSSQDAVIVLSSGGTGSASQALNAFMNQQGITGRASGTNSVNGLPAAVASFSAQTQQGTLAGWVAFVELDGSLYRLLGYTTSDRINTYDAVLRQSLGSFQRLTDPAALNVHPQVVRLVRLPRAMTLTQFNQSYPSVIPIAQLGVVNGVDPNATLAAGTTLKRVIVE